METNYFMYLFSVIYLYSQLNIRFHKRKCYLIFNFFNLIKKKICSCFESTPSKQNSYEGILLPYTQGILTNKRYTQLDFKLKLSTLLNVDDIRYTKNS